jgi:hypothetical protein
MIQKFNFNLYLNISLIHTFVNIPALLLKNTLRFLIRAGILTKVWIGDIVFPYFLKQNLPVNLCIAKLMCFGRTYYFLYYASSYLQKYKLIWFILVCLKSLNQLHFKGPSTMIDVVNIFKKRSIKNLKLLHECWFWYVLVSGG